MSSSHLYEDLISSLTYPFSDADLLRMVFLLGYRLTNETLLLLDSRKRSGTDQLSASSHPCLCPDLISEGICCHVLANLIQVHVDKEAENM